MLTVNPTAADLLIEVESAFENSAIERERPCYPEMLWKEVNRKRKAETSKKS